MEKDSLFKHPGLNGPEISGSLLHSSAAVELGQLADRNGQTPATDKRGSKNNLGGHGGCGKACFGPLFVIPTAPLESYVTVRNNLGIIVIERVVFL